MARLRDYPSVWHDDDGRVAVQSRMLATAPDKVAPWPYPTGGPGGSVALPERGNASQPDNFPFAPVAAGGLRVAPAAGWAPVARPGLDFATYGRRSATPHAIYALHLVRRFMSTGANTLANMVQPKPATTPGTLNVISNEGAPASPIPVYRRFIVESFVQPWGQGRVWNHYLPPPDVQKPAAVRRLLARRELPRMGNPFQPRLTRLVTIPTRGAPADQTLPAMPIGNTVPSMNPYAGR